MGLCARTECYSSPLELSTHDGIVQLIDGQPVYSATDLVGFLACEHLTSARARRRWRASSTADPARPRARPHPASAGSSTSSATSPTSRLQGRRVTEIQHRRARSRTAATQYRRPPQSDDRGDPPRRRRHLPGDVLRRPLARATPTSCSASSDAERSRSVELRGRGHQARAPARRRSALLQICSYIEAADADPGRRARVDARRPRRQRAQRSSIIRVGDYMAYYRLVRRRFEERSRPTPPAYPPAGTYPDAGRALRRLPLERAVPERGAGRTTTCRSSRASPTHGRPSS